MRIDRWRSAVNPVPPAELAALRADGVWPNLTVGEQLHLTAEQYPEEPAVITGASSITYRELDERTDRIAAGLAGLGLVPGDAVLTQLDNTVGAVVAWYAAIKAGLIPVATLLAHRGHEIGEIGAQTEAAAHIVSGDFRKFDLIGFALEMAQRVETPRIVIGVDTDDQRPGVVRIEELGADLDPAEARRIVTEIAAGIDGDDIAVFQLSGGTTGTPKVIPRLHDDYWDSSRLFAQRQGWDSRVRVMHFLPLIHNAGVVLALQAAHSVGAAVVISPSSTPELLALMESAGVTDFLGYPALAVEWSTHPDFDRAVGSLRRAVYSGTRVNDESFALFADRGVEVLDLYGASEGLILSTPRDWPAAARQHGLGTPLSDLDEVRILEPGTESEVADGTPGELCYRGPSTLRGYLRNSAANAESFTSTGLFRSGDLVARRVIEGQTTYTFEGRIKDLIHRGGEKVPAAEIEGMVMRMPGVARAALVPVADARLGERGCIVIEPVPGVEPPALADVTGFLARMEVAKFKWPERLEVVPLLPTTHVGKVDKRSLRDLFVPAHTDGEES